MSDGVAWWDRPAGGPAEVGFTPDRYVWRRWFSPVRLLLHIIEPLD